jgi:hypothetical protein
MIARPRPRFWLEAILASNTAVLAVVTAIRPTWIERVLHVDPDAGSGATEWGLVLVLAAATLVSGIAARNEWRRAAASSVS